MTEKGADSYTLTVRQIGDLWMAERRYDWDHEQVDRVYALTREEAVKSLPPPRAYQTYGRP